MRAGPRPSTKTTHPRQASPSPARQARGEGPGVPRARGGAPGPCAPLGTPTPRSCDDLWFAGDVDLGPARSTIQRGGGAYREDVPRWSVTTD